MNRLHGAAVSSQTFRSWSVLVDDTEVTSSFGAAAAASIGPRSSVFRFTDAIVQQHRAHGADRIADRSEAEELLERCCIGTQAAVKNLNFIYCCTYLIYRSTLGRFPDRYRVSS